MAHAINTLENTLRRIVLVMALAALLFPIAAWAADIVVLDDGTLTPTVQQGVTSRQDLAASGPDYSAIAFGVAAPKPPCSVCLPDSLLARWLESGTYDIPIPGLGTWALGLATAVGLVWLTHKKRRTQFGPNPMASFSWKECHLAVTSWQQPWSLGNAPDVSQDRAHASFHCPRTAPQALFRDGVGTPPFLSQLRCLCHLVRRTLSSRCLLFPLR